MSKLAGPELRAPQDGVSLHVGWPALSEVLGRLDSDVLRVVRAPSEASIPVNDVVILDPGDPRPVGEGAIVLGVGLR
ncbi:MAG: hypothetical protein ACRDK0_12285, partial [Solirubrobacteraceae bacterium]